MFKKRKFIYFAAGLLLFIFIFSVSVVFLKEPICQGRYLPFMRKWVHLIVPPKDLYKSIEEPIDLSSAGTMNVAFSLKYIGPYTVEIYPRNMPDGLWGTQYDTPLKADAAFYSDDTLLFKRDFEYDGSWGLGRGKGIPQFEINVPSDLPIGKRITCIVKIVTPDPYLNEKCDFHVIIQKRAEL
jgi:hypothetical protein